MTNIRSLAIEVQTQAAIVPYQKVFKLTPVKYGYIKIRLIYLTDEPKHARSHQLGRQGIKGPYVEDICILLPCVKVSDDFGSLLTPFEELKSNGYVSRTALLRDYQILDEDNTTLAYLFPSLL